MCVHIIDIIFTFIGVLNVEVGDGTENEHLITFLSEQEFGTECASNEESYSITLEATHIELKASNQKSFFYAVNTLISLLAKGNDANSK